VVVVGANDPHQQGDPTMDTHSRDNGLLCLKEVAAFFGNIDKSTVYRGIRKGLYPAAVKIGASSRWLRQECEAALSQMIERRSAQ
jgi:predicted DNA-binding transcriptional regulator AlpA